MSPSLPARPDLDQLRRQAKELRDAARRGEAPAVQRVVTHHRSAHPESASLAVAQLVVARELGYASWPKLKAAVDASAARLERTAEAFVAASIAGRLNEAAALLHADPHIAEFAMSTAALLGDVGAVRARIGADPEAAAAVDDERGWPALLYACYSPWHRMDPARAPGLVEVVRLLLAAGASPKTNNGAFRHGYRSALSGAVEVNNPSIVAMLLDAGANPDDGRCIEQAADRDDHRCLELLVARGARVAGTWAVGAAVYADQPRAVALLLDALRETTGDTASEATRGLADAAASNASRDVVAALLDAGADPDVRDSDAGLSALRCAVRAGDASTAALLARHGAVDDSTDVDRYIGACLAGDRRGAELLHSQHPWLHDRMTEEDRAVIVGAAATRSAETIAMMLDAGFSPRARNRSGEQPLHSAAYQGNAAVVRALLAAGADVDARDDRFEGTPLAFATVGSGEQAGKPGNWVDTVRLLIDAGASADGVWVREKPPSDEVAEVLRNEGIAPEAAPQDRGDDRATGEPDSIDPGPIAEVARHLEAAYRDEDLELLGSLLHPDVTWTGQCHNKAQVLDWYRGFQAEGTVATVTSVEIDRDAVVLGLSVARRAEGATPAPPQQLYQVARTEGGEIVDLRFYPDRHSALQRT